MLAGEQISGAVALGAFWFWPVVNGGWPALLMAALLALVGGLGILWHLRARAARRFRRAMNAYLDRQIAGTQQRRNGLAPETIPVLDLRHKLRGHILVPNEFRNFQGE